MTLDQIKAEVGQYRNILVIGCAAAGKTWLSKQLDPHDLYTLHCDDYLVHGEQRGFEDLKRECQPKFGQQLRIIEGGLGYRLLLEGFQEGYYSPELIIEVCIPAVKQRQVYLRERDANKLKNLRYFEMQKMAMLNEFLRICPINEQPKFIIFENDVTEKKDK